MIKCLDSQLENIFQRTCIKNIKNGSTQQNIAATFCTGKFMVQEIKPRHHAQCDIFIKHIIDQDRHSSVIPTPVNKQQTC